MFSVNITIANYLLLSVTFTENISEHHCAATVFTTYSFHSVLLLPVRPAYVALYAQLQ